MRARSFAWVTLAYVVALGAAWAVAAMTSTLEPLVSVALADLAATAVVFLASRLADNSSFYDPYWSVIPVAIAAWFARGAAGSPRELLVLAAVGLWSLRLTWNWARGWSGLAHEDWRYVEIRRQTKGLYWLVSFLGIHFFPSVLTLVGSFPLLPALTSLAPFALLDWLAALVTFGAIAIEAAADEQLRAFRRRTPGGTCTAGLWRFSRHPNYFGEISFWAGLWLFGVSAGAPAWMVLGPVAMVALFLGISIPLAEKRSLSRRLDYAKQLATVSRLVPWFPRRG